MANNVTVNDVVVATDDIGGAHLQRVKVGLGADDTAVDWRGDATGGGWMQGAVAHDAADVAKPVKMGLRAIAGVASATPVAAGDVSNAFGGLDGVQIVRPHCGLEDIVSGVDIDTDGASTAVIAAQGAGVRIYVGTVVVSNSHADTDAEVDLRDGTTGAVLATLPAPRPGATYRFEPPLPFSANMAVAVDPSAAVTTIKTTVTGFKSKV